MDRNFLVVLGVIAVAGCSSAGSPTGQESGADAGFALVRVGRDAVRNPAVVLTPSKSSTE